ncbi:GntR family transcriptional regulator [Prosthecomicrobium pneumaticum]|uniref:DNA-binding GntR family transcriptional regulator n=1 Tax=Prosthecomicrobium pneumaticum TaxID=81895 RepID=A0A7W9FQM2_9HYPH|nr:GntR family transcriptional regulator [Prosthecomicrobium pneumaticum]MBB5755083.1 DNA-binding GntR family transcriptional regulator [Prosthecomicrobium pneumaticum]
MPELERPRSLTALVTDRIRAMIVDGELPLGSAISERGISADLKVSKTPVREALAQLRHEGLVTVVPQSGARVFTLSAREVREICAFRKALETAALQIAMTEHPASLLRDLEAIEARMKTRLAGGDVRGYLELDTDFHLAFFANCGNSYLQNAYGIYSGKISALRTHLAQKPQHTSLSLKEHGEIVEAVRSGDIHALIDVLERHIGRTQETYEIGIEDISVA